MDYLFAFLTVVTAYFAFCYLVGSWYTYMIYYDLTTDELDNEPNEIKEAKRDLSSLSSPKREIIFFFGMALFWVMSPIHVTEDVVRWLRS